MGDSTKVSGRFDYGRRDPSIDKPKPFNPGPYAPEKTFADSSRDKFFGGAILQARLNNNFNQTNTPPAAVVDPQKVDAAVKSIQESLTETWTDWDVSKGDLKDIQKTFADLNAAEANEVFSKLSADDVKKYADELSGIMGGYGENDKQELFNELAGKLDARNLARLGDALLAREDGKKIDTSDVKLLSEAIAKNAPDAVKAEYLGVISGRIEKDEEFALGAAQILASLKNNPQALETAVQNLSDGQLKAVVAAASQETFSGNPLNGTPQVSYDTKPLVDLLGAVSGSQNASLKARVFEAAALQMKEISEAGSALPTVVALGKDAEVAQVRTALTNLLQSDATGIVTKLEKKNTAQGMTAYLKSMLGNGEGDKVRELIASLVKGNDSSENPAARIETNFGTPEKPIYQNARTLGFFAGSIFSATKQITDDVNKQADIIKNIFSAGFGAAGAANPASGVAASIANGLTAEAVKGIVDGINNETKDLRQALLELTLPPDASGEPYSGVAKDAYNGSFSATAIQNGFD